jgi:hypothetical protein
MRDYSRPSMPIGEAMFLQQWMRKFKPDPIPKEDLWTAAKLLEP